MSAETTSDRSGTCLLLWGRCVGLQRLPDRLRLPMSSPLRLQLFGPGVIASSAVTSVGWQFLRRCRIVIRFPPIRFSALGDRDRCRDLIRVMPVAPGMRITLEYADTRETARLGQGLISQEPSARNQRASCEVMRDPRDTRTYDSYLLHLPWKDIVVGRAPFSTAFLFGQKWLLKESRGGQEWSEECRKRYPAMHVATEEESEHVAMIEASDCQRIEAMHSLAARSSFAIIERQACEMACSDAFITRPPGRFYPEEDLELPRDPSSTCCSADHRLIKGHHNPIPIGGLRDIPASASSDYLDLSTLPPCAKSQRIGYPKALSDVSPRCA